MPLFAGDFSAVLYFSLLYVKIINTVKCRYEGQPLFDNLVMACVNLFTGKLITYQSEIKKF